MGARQKIEEKISKKEQEIQDLETQIREGRAYIVAMREALKLVPREGFTGAETLYRKGSLADKAQRAIAAHGAPMHIDDLVVAMRVKQDAKSKRSVAGTLASYVRKGEIFNRPAPNTFGLIGMEAEDDSDGESDDSQQGSSLREVAGGS